MKTLTTLMMLASCGMAMAQEGPEKKSDTTTFHLGNTKIIVTEDKAAKNDTTKGNDNDNDDDKKISHWSGFEMGVNAYMNADNSFTMQGSKSAYELDYSRSHMFRLNFAEHKLRIFDEYVGIVTGAGISFHGYQFKKSTVLDGKGPVTIANEDSIDYRKNKLKVTYLEVPLLLEINTSDDPKKTFHIAGGVVGGYKIGSKFKQKFDMDGNKVRNKETGHYNLNPFQLNATIRFGIGKLTLFGEYSLLPLFEKDKGPDLYTATAGIRLVGF